MGIKRWKSTEGAAGALLALIVAVGACGDDATAGPTGPTGGTGGATEGTVTLSMGTAATTSSSTAAFRLSSMNADLELGDGASTLVLSRVALVLRDIELERQFDDCDDSGTSNDSCEEFDAGPRIFDLPLDGSVDNVISLSGVPADVYDELEFKVHKPEDDTAEDLAFIQANPRFDGVSILVEGTFDGAPFAYTSDLNEEQEMPLQPPLEVGAGSEVNLTFSVDVDGWFRRADGSLVDPATANKGGPNEQLVEDNIEASIDIFEDSDHDGQDDSDDD